jgi:actin-like ATPase involved in cell morphogenesis
MKPEERESIRKLQDSIREQRTRVGMPAESTVESFELLEAMRKKPPIQKIVAFVRSSLQQKTSGNHSGILIPPKPPHGKR